MKNIFLISLTVFFILSFSKNNLANDNIAITVKTSRGFSFELYDIKSSDYSYPAFKFFLKSPDRTTIGWDENNNKWTGEIKESYVSLEPFFYPRPDQECASNVEYKSMKINMPYSLRGTYSINTALYCKNLTNNENTFISSAYDGGFGNTPDGKYELHILPTKYAIIKFCYSFLVENEEEDINIFCTYEEYTKKFLIIPNHHQTIEIVYNHTDRAENKIKKVVTPALLADGWEGCYKLGLIKNFGLYNSINKKLLNAKEKYDVGAVKTAINIYSATLNEIEAQYGKGISIECGNILIMDIKDFLAGHEK